LALHTDRHINVECVAYMFRVVAALLLVAAALAAMDLSGLVDAVFNTTSPLERFAPTYVFEIDGCRVLAYVVNSTLKNSPLEAWIDDAGYSTYDPVYHPRDPTLRLLTSAEVERLLDALFQALGPSVKARVGVWTIHTWCNGGQYVEVKDVAQGTGEAHGAVVIVSPKVVVVPGVEYAPLCVSAHDEYLRLEVRNAAQLVEEVQRAVGVDFYLGVADVRETLLKKRETSEGATVRFARLYRAEWRHGDLIAVFTQETWSAYLIVKTANFSAAVEALKKAREAAGEVWNSVTVMLWHGPYLLSSGEAKALREAAWMLKEERGGVWEFIDEEGQVRRVWGFVDVFSVDELGPLYVLFPYPSSVVPDKATAERLVRRLVELSGFCKSPLVVEFWPKPELRPQPMEQSPPLWPYAVAIATVAAINIGFVVFARRRK